MQTLLFAIATGVGLGAFIYWVLTNDRKRAVANLRRVAERQRLQLLGAEGSLFSQPWSEGLQHGRMVRFWTYTTGSGKSRQHWAAVGVVPRAGGDFSFDLRPQGWLTKVSEFFGAKEARTGDAAFDERWFLQTNSPETLGAALVPEVRAKLDAVRAAGAKGHFRAEGGVVRYAEMGGFSHGIIVTRLESALPLLHDLADVVEVCAGPTSR